MLEKYKIVLKILVPFIIALAIVSGVSMIGMYFLQKNMIQARAVDQFQDVSEAMDSSIDHDTRLFENLLQIIQHDNRTLTLFQAKKRDELYLHLTTLYQEFNTQYGIDRVNFHNSDGTNFLRMSDPSFHSDRIQLETLAKAMETGETASGVEFGSRHNLTLHVVTPWYHGGKLAGYIELAKDLEHLTPELSGKYEAEIIMTLKQEMINPRDYKEWNKAPLNDRLSYLKHFYVIDSTLETFSPKLQKILDSTLEEGNLQIRNTDKTFCLNSKKFYDGSGKQIGNLYVLIDITDELKNLNQQAVYIALLMAVLILLLSYYYYAVIDKIYKKLSDFTRQTEVNYRFEKYLNNISTDLMHSNDFDRSIQNTMALLGKSLDADRSFLVRFEEDYAKMVNTHEWCATGVYSKKKELKNVSTEGITWWVNQCRNLKPIVFENLDDLPPEAAKEKADIAALQIKAALIYPIISYEKAIGFVGVEMHERSPQWSDTHHSFVKITAEIISSAYDKKVALDQLTTAYDNVSLILDTAYNGILAVDENNKILMYNRQLLEIWGVPRLDPHIDSLEKIFEFVSPLFSEHDRYAKEMNFFLQNRELKRTYRLHLKDKRILEGIVIPIFKDGVFKGNSFSFRDITQKVAYENELQLSQKVFENSLEGIVITDEKSNILKVNKAFKALTGYSDEDIYGNNPTLFKSNWHDKEFYHQMWEKLEREGIWEGEIKDRRKNGEFYISNLSIIQIKDTEGHISNYIGISRDITRIKENEEKIKLLAFYDPLTNLPNRTLFHDRLGQAILDCHRNGTKMALLFLDLDYFKAVNDTHGHHTGDILLQKVAVILKECVRESDIVSRLAGDEFTIILKQIASKEDVEHVAENIIRKLREPIVIEKLSINIGTSIGVAMYPDDSGDEKQLLKMADAAMYKAKENGKNCLEFF